MTTILGGLLLGGAALYYTAPGIKKGVQKLSGSSMAPHQAVETIIDFFKSLGDKEGIKAARECGKRIYDAMGGKDEE